MRVDTQLYHIHHGDWQKQDYGIRLAFIATTPQEDPQALQRALGLEGVERTSWEKYRVEDPDKFITPSPHGTIYGKKTKGGMHYEWAQHLEDRALALIRIHNWSLGPRESLRRVALLQAKKMERHGMLVIPSRRSIVSPEHESRILEERVLLDAIQKH